MSEGYWGWSADYDPTVYPEMSIDLLERITCNAWSTLSPAVDLACATGLIGAWLKRKGLKEISGVDLTPEMSEKAEARKAYDLLGIGDIRETGLPEQSFGLVVNSFADEHIPDLAPRYREAYRLARQ